MDNTEPEPASAPVDAEDKVGDAAARQSFFDHFRAQEQSIREALGSLAASTENGKTAHVHTTLDALLVRTQALEAEFSQSVDMLPAYDVQRCRTTLKALVNGISAKREELVPQKKFSFKRRSAPQGQPMAGPSECSVPAASSGSSSPPSIAGKGPSTATEQVAHVQSCSEQQTQQQQQQQQQHTIRDSCNQAMILGSGELQGRDVALCNLEGCQVFLLDRIGALHCHGLRRCEVLVGAVTSSALLYDCCSCVVTLAAKQLRLHDSQEVLLHLHALSKPVIEHSSRILFAPYDLSYTGLDNHLSEAALGQPAATGDLNGDGVAEWSDVQDFNWHRRQASPNWRVVPSELRRAPVELDIAQLPSGTLPPALIDLERCLVCITEAGPTQAKAPQEVPVVERHAEQGGDVPVQRQRLSSEDEF